MSDATSRLSDALAGRYTIERELGQGGMATVYLAQDLKHDRKVALKVLRPELAAVLGAERFVQEIKTTAALQHPHILPLFDSGTAGQQDGSTAFLYYVMPYIEGETLRDKLNREKQLTIDEAVKITTEVADALDYAHRHGVIHRDIKPENILLHDGRPMVADFGIALAVSVAAGDRMTETGMSVGTPHYMSPEQASAQKDLTGRSDIYSLGAVLYEMLTGEPPHTGSTVQQIVMRIVTEEATSVTTVRKSVPPNVAAALGKAMEKLPADRFESAQAFAAALSDESFAGRYETARPAVSRSSARRTAFVATAAAAAGLVLGWLVHSGPGQPGLPVTRFTVPVPAGHTMANGYNRNLDVSEDGRRLTYMSGSVLYVQALDRFEPKSLGAFPELALPRFSPDGRWVFFGNTLSSDEILGVSVDSGPLVDVTQQLRDADLVYGGNDGIFRRRPQSESWERITTIASARETAHVLPQLLPGGTAVLYTILDPSYMWHGATVVVEDLETGERTTVAERVTHGRYVASGHIVYVDVNGTLHGVPFDAQHLRTTGSPFVVESGLRTAYWGGAASFAVSDAGTLAFVRGSSWENHRLTWLDRHGAVIGHVGRPVTVEGVRLSPDGRYAVTYVASDNSDISLFDLESGEDRRLTFDPETEDNPVWSPDSRRIAYRHVSGREHNILIRSVSRQGAPELVFTFDHFAAPRSWSPDGEALAILLIGAQPTLVVLDLADSQVDTVAVRGADEGGRFSPNGRWLAYVSRETGRYEVYVVSYPDLTAKQQVSVSGGRLPEWSRDSGELFFVNADTLMVTSVETGEVFSRSMPRALFVSPGFENSRWYGVSADGQRILYAAPNPDAPAHEIHVVLNWIEELRVRGGT